LARSVPSTRTLMLPSGSFTLCTIFASVPTEWISSGFGSSTEASCWVTRKIFLSPASASSSARTDASRPTMNGCIISGKMTISRTGIIGTRFTSSFSLLNIYPTYLASLLDAARRRKISRSVRNDNFPGAMRGPEELERSAGLFEQAPVDFAALDHVRRDDEIAKLTLRRQVVHHF